MREASEPFFGPPNSTSFRKAGRNGKQSAAVPRRSGAPPLPHLTARNSALESGGWGSHGRKSVHLA